MRRQPIPLEAYLEFGRLVPKSEERNELIPVHADDERDGTEGQHLQKAVSVLLSGKNFAPLNRVGNVPECSGFMDEECGNHERDNARVYLEQQAGNDGRAHLGHHQRVDEALRSSTGTRDFGHAVPYPVKESRRQPERKHEVHHVPPRGDIGARSLLQNGGLFGKWRRLRLKRQQIFRNEPAPSAASNQITDSGGDEEQAGQQRSFQCASLSERTPFGGKKDVLLNKIDSELWLKLRPPLKRQTRRTDSRCGGYHACSLAIVRPSSRACLCTLSNTGSTFKQVWLFRTGMLPLHNLLKEELFEKGRRRRSENPFAIGDPNVGCPANTSSQRMLKLVPKDGHPLPYKVRRWNPPSACSV